MNQVIIRRYEPADQKQVYDMVSHVMDAEFHDEKHAYPMDDLKNIGLTYGGMGEAFFVALHHLDGVIGTAAIKREDDRVALLRRLFVAAPFRQKKVGKKLLEESIRFCNAIGYDEIIFKTTSRMKAASLMCQKGGFVQRAKIQLGQLELFKFSMLLSSGAEKMKS